MDPGGARRQEANNVAERNSIMMRTVMNILIVDDDKYVLEGIRNGVNWESLPIDHRYEARNGYEAREILNHYQIHIMVCDIEMPQESGLELLAWLRSKGSEVQTVFLTSYADFNYAQRALQLGSFEYFLKPIEYDKLARIIAEAANNIKKKEIGKQYQLYGQYWIASEQTRKEYFWTKVMERRHPFTEEEIYRRIQEERLDYTREDGFILIALQLPEGEEGQGDLGKYNPDITAIITQALERKELKMEAAWQESREQWFVIVRIGGLPDTAAGILKNIAVRIRQQLLSLSKKPVVYYSKEIGITQAYEQTLLIKQMMFNNLTYQNGIFYVEERGRTIEKPEVLVDFKEAGRLLLEGNKKELLLYVDRTIENAEKDKNITIDLFERFRIDWLQIIFSYLHENQVEADRLFANKNYRDRYERSSQSIIEFRAYLGYMIDTAIDYVSFVRESDDIILKIEHYINQHLNRTITRADIAEIVYLNSDYIAQIFKKKMGIPLMKYINNKRLERAKELLLTTNKPVYTIACEVGYPTSSYFSKQFRETYGISPNEYRKN